MLLLLLEQFSSSPLMASTVLLTAVLFILCIAVNAKQSQVPLCKGTTSLEPAIVSFLKSPHRYLLKAYKQHGSVFAMRIGFRRVVWFCAGQHSKMFFAAKEEDLSFHKAIEPNVAKLFHISHVQAPWLNFMIGGFNSRPRMRLFLDCLAEVQTKAFASWTQDETIGGPSDLFRALYDLTADTMTMFIFGSDFLEKHGRELSTSVHALTTSLGSVTTMSTPSWLFWTSGNRALQKNKRQFLNIVHAEIEQRLSQARNSNHSTTSEDYLQYLFDKDNLIHKDEYAEHILVLYFAATVNTVAAFGWIVAHLAQSNKIQKMLCQELQEQGITVDSFDRDGTDVLSLSEHLGNSRILSAIESEAMRLHPVFFHMQIAVRETTLDGVVLEKGDLAMLAPPIIFRDPKVFYEPDDFVPERWLNAKENDNAAALDFDSFQPWGFGGRRCKGEKLAKLLLRTTVARLALTYDMAIKDYSTTSSDGKLPSIPSQPDKIFGPSHSLHPLTLQLKVRA